MRRLSQFPNMSCGNPQEFEQFMREHLRRKGYDVEKPWRNGSQPDAETRVLFIFKTMYDAKAKSQITYVDIDKLARDVRAHHAIGGILYVCSAAEVAETQLGYARQRGIRIIQLGWNGRETELT